MLKLLEDMLELFPDRISRDDAIRRRSAHKHVGMVAGKKKREKKTGERERKRKRERERERERKRERQRERETERDREK